MSSLFESGRLGCLALITCSVAVLAPPSNAQWYGHGRGPGPDDIPEGYMLYQGDILLPLDYFDQEATFSANIWPSVIPYEYDANMTTWKMDQARAAMDELETVCHVFFVPLTDQSDYLHIQDAAFNNSPVGRQGGEQVVQIASASWLYRYTIIHELMHAMGYWHEQARTDRDLYVQINWDNISQTDCPGGSCDHNFLIQTGSGHWGPYDFDSVMHYPADAWSANGLDTITVLPPNEEWQSEIGQNNHLSEYDQITLSYIYREPDWRFVRNPSAIGFGTFFLPFDEWTSGYSDVPAGGKVIFLDEGATTYSAVGVYTKAVTVEATLAPITLGT